MKKILLFLILSMPAIAFSQEPFPVKAFHIDNRIQVMPMPELMSLAETLHQSGINTIIMEYEGSFPFMHNGIISNRYAYAPGQVEAFVQHCASLDIDVIPLQQCLGHLEYILQFDRYADLREDRYDVSQLCPLKREKARSFYDELITEMIALHPSKYFHIGGDEAFLLGHCDACHAFAEEHGKSQLYVDYIKMITELVIEKGKIPVLWADIVMKHPEAISALPEECVLVNWNYGWDLSRFGDHDNLVNSGLELWGALALRSSPDNFFLTSWKTHFKNLEEFIPEMRAHHYRGVVMTSWSTSGRYTYLREPRDNIIEMYPIRHVYPLVGFQMMIDAYAEAIESEPFSAKDFVIRYGQERFGLSGEAAETFYDGLNARVETIRGGKTSAGRELGELLDDTKAFCTFLHRVEVAGNEEEFEHSRLMYDIRLHYIQSRIVMYEIEEMVFTDENVSTCLVRLEELRNEGKSLSRRFSGLHKDHLYPGSIAEENFIRGREIEVLYDRLSRAR